MCVNCHSRSVSFIIQLHTTFSSTWSTKVLLFVSEMGRSTLKPSLCDRKIDCFGFDRVCNRVQRACFPLLIWGNFASCKVNFKFYTQKVKEFQKYQSSSASLHVMMVVKIVVESLRRVPKKIQHFIICDKIFFSYLKLISNG